MRFGIFSLRKGLTAFGVSIAAVLMASMPTSVFAQSGGGSPDQLQAMGAYKASHDTDPHAGDSFASSSTTTRSGRTSGGSAMTASASITYSYPVNYLIGKNQQGQQTGYWCGPAAVSEAVGLWGYSYSQTTEASIMHTTSSAGTAWSGVNAAVPSAYLTGHPVRDTLDYQVAANSGSDPGYAVVAVPYTPTQTDINNYISHLQLDIWAGYPMVADAWEVAGYNHLTGHPKNQTIFHWFTIIGYESNGTLTSYEDSATTVWTTVPAYTMNFNSATLVGIIGGRGYVW